MKFTLDLPNMDSPNRILNAFVFYRRIGNEVRMFQRVKIYQTVARGSDRGDFVGGEATWYYKDSHFVD